MARIQTFPVQQVARMHKVSEDLIREFCMANMIPGATIRADRKGIDYRIPASSLPAVRAALRGEAVCSRCAGSQRDPDGGPCAECQEGSS